MLLCCRIRENPACVWNNHQNKSGKKNRWRSSLPFKWNGGAQTFFPHKTCNSGSNRPVCVNSCDAVWRCTDYPPIPGSRVETQPTKLGAKDTKSRVPAGILEYFLIKVLQGRGSCTLLRRLWSPNYTRKHKPSRSRGRGAAAIGTRQLSLKNDLRSKN
jgi:hypothetical protein